MSDQVVSQKKKKALLQRMFRLGIFEKDLRERFIRGSGRGGQKVNKTSSCVYLLHLPSRIDVKFSQTRSRELNRFLARRALCDRLESKILGAQSAQRQAAEKIRRQKRRRTRRQKQRMLEDKHLHAEKKKLRKTIFSDEHQD